jgi:hypothetical protein
MKKGLLASIFGVSFVASLVSAAPDFTQISNDLINSFSNFSTTPGFTKVLFFLLLFLIVDSIVSLIPLFSGKRFVAMIIALIISTLGIFYIPQDMISSMVNPYSAMGIAILSIIPFIVIFLFTQYSIQNRFLKQITWMFFAFTLLYLSISSSFKVNTIGAWVYGAASCLALLMVFMSNKISQMLWEGKQEEKLTAAQRRMQQRLTLDVMKEQEAQARGL